MEILNTLSAEDKILIENYIANYAGGDEGDVWGVAPTVDMNTILAPWAEAKSKYLWDLMGHQFIHTREISYTITDEELVKQFDVDWGETGNAIERFLTKLLNEGIGMLADRLDENYFDVKGKICCLCCDQALATNKFDGFEPMTIGKISVPVGCKTMRVLNKIVKEYLPEFSEMFEEFRLEHSRLLNQRTLKGTLCLSIHPLDYMTMSDNDNDWDSCMNWQKRGEYRQGTVEMMNSPCVVVAYLHNPSNLMQIPGGEWNNKKWRCLYIVDQTNITEIHSYPYQNEYISSNALSWLRELAEKNLLWDYNDERSIYLDPENTDCKHKFNFYTNKMYSDFRFKHIMYVGKTAKSNNSINYSGVSECMCCGDYPLDFYLDASELVCPSCNGMIKCDNCGNWTYSDDVYHVDGLVLCATCDDEETYMCPICGEYHMVDDDLDNRTIRLIHKDMMYSHRIEFCPEHYKQFINGEIDYGASMIYQCVPVKEFARWWSSEYNYGVELTELNDEGLDAFGVYRDMIEHFESSVARFRYEFTILDKIRWRELKTTKPTE